MLILNSSLNGGIYPICGLCMASSELGNDYAIKSSTPYTLTTELPNSVTTSNLVSLKGHKYMQDPMLI